MIPKNPMRANIEAAQRLSTRKPAVDRQLCGGREDGHLPVGR
ncbi:hypothetical protein ACIA8C_40565 [Nocardia sp. NPDC051321]